MSEPEFEDPRVALRRHGFRPKKSFSQSFLISEEVVEAIARAAGDVRDLHVVELGPGVGTLTGALLRRGAIVTAIERDRDMAKVLRADLADYRFTLVEADAAKLDLAPFASPDKPVVLVGNLPYAITGQILRRVTAQRELISRAVFMVQREVRDRWLGAVGTKAYGAPTVFLRAGFDLDPVRTVDPDCFHPPPRVTSAVVRLRPLETPRAAETQSLRRVVRAAFGMRRKTLRNALKKELGAELASEALAACAIDAGRRGETLDIAEFDRLARYISENDPRQSDDSQSDESQSDDSQSDDSQSDESAAAT